jgi:3-oxo-5-alpha-steroid 4-dehydrogenase 1
MEFSNQFLLVWSVIALVAFFALFFKTAPYGRHENEGWGKTISSRLGWIIMETPSVYIMLIIAYIFYESLNFILIVFLAIWLLHYLNRSLIWPLRAKIKNKKMALIVAVLAFTFNTVNASIQALWIFKFTTYDNNWLYSFPFIAGLIIFFIGMYINIKSDNILFGLRREQDQGYHIPEGFLFNKVSNPNYFGEMIEWLGWAIMTWNLAGLIFFIWTVANLLPRAVANHNWYLDKFDNYPEERKILIPDFY